MSNNYDNLETVNVDVQCLDKIEPDRSFNDLVTRLAYIQKQKAILQRKLHETLRSPHMAKLGIRSTKELDTLEMVDLRHKYWGLSRNELLTSSTPDNLSFEMHIPNYESFLYEGLEILVTGNRWVMLDPDRKMVTTYVLANTLTDE